MGVGLAECNLYLPLGGPQEIPLLKISQSWSFLPFQETCLCDEVIIAPDKNNIHIEQLTKLWKNLNLALSQNLNVIPTSCTLKTFVNSWNSHRYTPCDFCVFNNGRWSGNNWSLKFWVLWDSDVSRTFGAINTFVYLWVLPGFKKRFPFPS